MELRQLRYFQAVAEELHFRKAAERLHISQPPLSQQIRALEKELGVLLFDRNRRRVELTTAGAVLQRGVEQLFRELEMLIEDTKRAADGLIGALSVSFVGSLSHGVIPPLVRNFKNRYPQIALRLQPLTTAQQIFALQQGEIDMGLVRDVPPSGDFELLPLFTEPLLLAVPQASGGATTKPVSLREFSDQSFITIPRRLAPDFYDAFIGACQSVGFSPNIEQEIAQFPSMLGLVSAEMGVCVTPQSMAITPVQGVAYLPLKEELFSTVYLIWRKGLKKQEASLFMATLESNDFESMLSTA